MKQDKRLIHGSFLLVVPGGRLHCSVLTLASYDGSRFD
jgi:hypothetical protein